MGSKITPITAIGSEVQETSTAREEHGGGICFVAMIFIVASIIPVACFLTIGLNTIFTAHVYRPNSPYVEITDARLDKLHYNNLTHHVMAKINLTVDVIARNDDATSSFDSLLILLQFHNRVIADLRVHAPKSSLSQNYTLNSWNNATLHDDDDDDDIHAMTDALKEGKVPFYLSVITDVKWRVGDSQHLDSKGLHVRYLELPLPMEFSNSVF